MPSGRRCTAKSSTANRAPSITCRCLTLSGRSCPDDPAVCGPRRLCKLRCSQPAVQRPPGRRVAGRRPHRRCLGAGARRPRQPALPLASTGERPAVECRVGLAGACRLRACSSRLLPAPCTHASLPAPLPQPRTRCRGPPWYLGARAPKRSAYGRVQQCPAPMVGLYRRDDPTALTTWRITPLQAPPPLRPPPLRRPLPPRVAPAAKPPPPRVVPAARPPPPRAAPATRRPPPRAAPAAKRPPPPAAGAVVAVDYVALLPDQTPATFNRSEYAALVAQHAGGEFRGGVWGIGALGATSSALPA